MEPGSWFYAVGHADRIYRGVGADASFHSLEPEGLILREATPMTADLDVTVELGERTAAQLVDTMTSCGFVLRVAAHDREFIERSRVLPLVHEGTSLPVDLVLVGPGREEMRRRAG
jgi:hypothetical protein